jgi:RNA polymerase sigma factor (sigma-70 family)
VGVRAYLFGAVKNAMYKTHRHEQVVTREHAALAREMPYIVDPVEPDDTARMRRQFRLAFRALTLQQRMVLRLRYEQLLSAREIAAIFDVSTRAVERMLGRAIQSLRAAIET